ncbi:helix-turn-helix transcriptional regulator [Mycolicibacterium hippocampi]|uniref:HTH luxR-type domain-containing protein n=1 Tax=Mycolicibacterium hippocampi TaxID=659824 RepID=A0A7I9ZRU0_9MYCO|nr:helix-turn-helix transcriptional regulator [Mycolicibacterium hippocampi]GFH03569.1 hypothetical protein MHIP_40520 [Mycolicibacterium hippocampi]
MNATPFTESDPVAAGRAALERANWAQARACFEEAVASGDAAEAWEGLSRAAWWQGDQDVVFVARERAYRCYQQRADACGAARMAMWLASDHLDFLGDDAVATAWLRRARSLTGDLAPCPEQGYNLLLEADIALLCESDPATAMTKAREAVELAGRIPDVGVEVVGLAILGSALVALGAVEEGLQRLDECAALAVAEDFSEIAAPGWALCHTVSVCANVGDFGRAAQWCRALHKLSEVWQARHFFGVCRTAYGDVLATRGDWVSAEQELVSAIEDLRITRPALAAPSAVRLGRLRASQGDLGEARKLFESALPAPQALLALGELNLAGGDADAAADAADRVLRNLGDASILERFPALELRARAHAAAGATGGAIAVVEEIEGLAVRLGTPYMRARSLHVRANVLAAVGDHDGARQAAEDSADLFTACSAPYDEACVRMVLAAALQALGHGARADGESRAALEAMALLRSPRDGAGSSADELSTREVEILRLVAQGLGDGQIAERLFLSPHTVHRHVANIRTKLRTPSRAAAVSYATRHGLLD